MTRRSLEKASRVVARISLALGILGMGFGAVIFWADGGKDLGGIVGGVFFSAGLFLTLQALPYAGKKD
jgi:hypothetical protein